MNIPSINYSYHFIGWDDFVVWLKDNGFQRYESGMPCWRCYFRDDIIIEVSYYTSIPNRIMRSVNRNFFPLNHPVILEFFEPKEITHDLLKSFVK